MTMSAVLRLAKLEALDHGAQGTVKHHDAFLQDVGQCLAPGVVDCAHGAVL